MLRTALFLLVCLACRSAAPYDVLRVSTPGDAGGPSILCVVAHPDDEIAFAGTIYASSLLLGGATDVAVITNGEGGYKYSTLAEPHYGVELTDEETGRFHLPQIRRFELWEGCFYLRVRDLFFLDQKDHRYTQDVNEVLGPDAGVWNLDYVRGSLRSILAEGDYDFVFTLAPTEETHGHHKAATLLALEVVEALPVDARPAVLCARVAETGEPPPEFSGLTGFPITATTAPPFAFDRTRPFGHRERLSYKIVVNWAIAAHKSQGTMQLLMNRGDEERYFLFDVGPPDAAERVRAFFRALEVSPFEAQSYPGEE